MGHIHVSLLCCLFVVIRGLVGLSKSNMCHREIHDQSVRRRKSVVLYFRFLQDYVVFDFNVTSFFTSRRSYLVGLNFVTHVPNNDPNF